jgi:hypothetical protein
MGISGAKELYFLLCPSRIHLGLFIRYENYLIGWQLTLGKTLTISEGQFPHLASGDNYAYL